MKEMVLIVGKKQHQIRILEENLREKGYVPFTCKTVSDIVDTIYMMPETKAHIPLVIIDAAILDHLVVNNEALLMAQLSNCDKRIPFIVTGETELKSESTEIFYKLCEGRKCFKSEENHLGKAIRKSFMVITYPGESLEEKK